MVGLFQAFPKSTRHLPNAWIPHDVFVVAAHRENLHTTQCESAPAQIVLEWVEHGVSADAEEGDLTRVRPRLVTHPCLVINFDHTLEITGEFFQFEHLECTKQGGRWRRGRNYTNALGGLLESSVGTRKDLTWVGLAQIVDEPVV